MNQITCKFLLALILAIFSTMACAEYAVIANNDNAAEITQTDVERLFTARINAFPDGALAIPLNHEEGTLIRAKFESAIIGRTEAQMKAYWARLLFTGKATPIKQMETDAEVMELVAKNPSIIGYVKKSSINDSVRVVLEF